MSFLVYKLVNFVNRLYWKEWEKQTKKKLKACGSDVHIGPRGTFSFANIEMGNHISIAEGACMIATNSTIYIGDYVMMGPNVMIRGGNHRTDVTGKYMIEVGQDQKLSSNDADVIINKDVWIGANVTILSGIEIGEGSVIGAGSVVTKNVPPYTFHVGTHDIKEWKRFSDAQLTEHKNKLSKRFDCFSE